MTKFFTISLHLTKLYVTERFAIASSVTYSEICQNFYTVRVYSGHVKEAKTSPAVLKVPTGPTARKLTFNTSPYQELKSWALGKHTTLSLRKVGFPSLFRFFFWNLHASHTVSNPPFSIKSSPYHELKPWASGEHALKNQLSRSMS